MSGKSGYPGAQQLDCNGIGLCLIAGSFTTADGAEPTIRSGKGFTVSRDAEGVWLVTLSRPFSEIVAITATIAAETLTNELDLVVVDQDSITTSAFKLKRVFNADTSANASAADDQPGDEIHFILVGRYSSIDY